MTSFSNVREGPRAFVFTGSFTAALSGNILSSTARYNIVILDLKYKIWDLKIRPYCVGVDVSDIFFNSTAERLAIYSQFRYISRIFPTVFSQLISIFIRLHTYCMGAKTRARLT